MPSLSSSGPPRSLPAPLVLHFRTISPGCTQPLDSEGNILSLLLCRRFAEPCLATETLPRFGPERRSARPLALRPNVGQGFSAWFFSLRTRFAAVQPAGRPGCGQDCPPHISSLKPAGFRTHYTRSMTNLRYSVVFH